jgi:PEP-CTERM motif-containing protein
MRQLKHFIVFAGLATCLATYQLMAAPIACTDGSYASYVSAYPDLDSSCTIGVPAYKWFQFNDLTPGGGSLTSADFLVSPDHVNGGFSITIPSGIYVEEYYYLRYVVDPAPILGGEELSMDGFFSDFSAFFDGPSLFAVPTALASKWACPQGFLSGLPNVALPIGQGSVGCNSLQPGQPTFLQVGPGESDSASFTDPVAFTHVGILFYLNGDLPDITARTTPTLIDLSEIPEPSSMMLLGGGLAGLLALRKRKK